MKDLYFKIKANTKMLVIITLISGALILNGLCLILNLSSSQIILANILGVILILSYGLYLIVIRVLKLGHIEGMMIACGITLLIMTIIQYKL